MAEDTFKTEFSRKFLELAQKSPRFNKNGAADVIIGTFLHPDEDRALIHQIYARFAQGNENYVEARAHLEVVLNIEPNHTEAQGEMAECLFKLGRYAEAAPYFTRLREQYPSDFDIRFQHAYSLFKSGDANGPALLEKSLGDYDDLIQIYPNEIKDALCAGMRALRQQGTVASPR